MKLEKGLFSKHVASIQSLLAKNSLGSEIVEAVQSLSAFVANGLVDSAFGPNDFLQTLVLSKDIEFAKLQKQSQVEQNIVLNVDRSGKKIGDRDDERVLLATTIQTCYNDGNLSRKLKKGLPAAAWDALTLVVSLLSPCESSQPHSTLVNIFDSAVTSWNSFSSADQVIVYELISSALFFSMKLSTEPMTSLLSHEMIVKFFELALQSRSNNDTTFLRFAHSLQKLLLTAVYHTSLCDSEACPSLPVWSLGCALMLTQHFATFLSHVAESFFKATFILQRKSSHLFFCSDTSLEKFQVVIIDLTAKATTMFKTTAKLLISIGTDIIDMSLKKQSNMLLLPRVIISMMIALTRVHTSIEPYDYFELQDRWNKLLTALIQSAILAGENDTGGIVSDINMDEELLHVIQVTVLDILPTVVKTKNCAQNDSGAIISFLARWLNIHQSMLNKGNNGSQVQGMGFDAVDHISYQYIHSSLLDNTIDHNHSSQNKYSDFCHAADIAGLLHIIYNAWDNLHPTTLSSVANNDKDNCSSFISLPVIPQLLQFIKECSCEDRATVTRYRINHSIVQSVTSSVDNLLEKLSSRLFAHHLDYYIIKAWMCLLAARSLFLMGNDLVTAMIYAKKAYSYAHNGSVVGHHVIMIIKLETSLFLLELYEALGKVSRAVDMLCTLASSMTTIGRYRAVLLLSVLKVWVRSDSSRLLDLLQSMVIEFNEMKDSDSGNVLRLTVQQLLESYPAVKAQLNDTQMYLSLESVEAKNKQSRTLIKLADYRCINGMWEATGMNFTHCNFSSISRSASSTVIKQDEINSASELSLICSFPFAKWIRKQLCSQLSSAIGDNNKKGTSNDDDNEVFLISTVQSMRAPSYSLSGIRSNTDFRCFLLGSSASFLTSWERAMDKDHPAVILMHDAITKPGCSAEEQLRVSIQNTLHLLSAEATIVYLTIFPENGELLCGSLTADGQCKNFVLADGNDFILMMESWHHLVDRNHTSLHATKDPAVIQSLNEKQRRDWWKQRQQLDNEIKEMLHEFEQLLAPVKSLFSDDQDAGDGDNDCSMSMMSHDDGEHGRSMIEEEEEDELDRLVSLAFDQIHLDDTIDHVQDTMPAASVSAAVDYTQMKVEDLKVILKQRKLNVTGKKADLIERLVADDNCKKSQQLPPASSTRTTTTKLKQHQPQAMTRKSVSASTVKMTTTSTTAVKAPQQAKLKQRGHIILIIDELLQAFPIESIPTLRNRSCSRCLGLVHFLSVIIEPTRTEAKDIGKCWYAVDVENNLPDTRKVMTPFFENQSQKFGWQGYVGTIPPAVNIRKHQDKNDLFIYCGHGAGVALHGLGCYSHNSSSSSSHGNDEASHEATTIEKLAAQQKITCPAALLWGCSSGRLLRRGYHDPYGPILTYLQHGASFVAANLWDVTDRDLDGMSLECMQHFFTNDHPSEHDSEEMERNQNSIANCLTEARAICRMRFVVGAAAIIYGLPTAMNFSSKLQKVVKKLKRK